LTALSNIAIVGTFIVYYFLLKAMRKQLDAGQEAARGQNFFTLINFLQEDSKREARKFVLEHLAHKPQDDWTDDDKKKASIVCSSYDAASIAYREQLIDTEVFAENYGRDIERCYQVLKTFIQESQAVRGSDYWNDLQQLGEELLAKDAAT
jgi:hypothetical protein